MFFLENLLRKHQPLPSVEDAPWTPVEDHWLSCAGFGSGYDSFGSFSGSSVSWDSM